MQVWDGCSIPTGVFGGSVQWWEFSKASFEDKSLLFTFPQELFIFFS